IHQPGFYSELEEKTRELANQLVERGRAHGVSVSTNTIGGMFTLFFADAPPRNFDEVNRCDHARYRKFFHGMLEGGVFFPPSPFESAFPSWAHTQATIESTLKVAERVFQGL
ncbi:MAG TPA: aspartate aminotransferase family protein, partial [Sulfobacillus sp.]|nr:aspartate aminotransferase family protein [Sulfobacillus sp.]